MSDKGFVYLLSAKGSGLHKIGHTGDIEKRMAQLQTGSSGELELVKSWPGSRDDEKALHRKLDGYRQGGEWFRFPKCVLHELSLMDEFNIEAIRMPDYNNPWQIEPIGNIVTAIGEVIEIAANATVVEMAERLRAHLNPFFWAPMLDIDPEPIDKMIAEFETIPLDKRTQKRVARMRNSFKAFLHWRSIEEREQARGGMTMRERMRQFMHDAFANRQKPAEERAGGKRYIVKIKAQVEWECIVENAEDGPELAKTMAQEDFELSASTNSISVALINKITVEEYEPNKE